MRIAFLKHAYLLFSISVTSMAAVPASTIDEKLQFAAEDGLIDDVRSLLTGDVKPSAEAVTAALNLAIGYKTDFAMIDLLAQFAPKDTVDSLLLEMGKQGNCPNVILSLQKYASADGSYAANKMKEELGENGFYLVGPTEEKDLKELQKKYAAGKLTDRMFQTAFVSTVTYGYRLLLQWFLTLPSSNRPDQAMIGNQFKQAIHEKRFAIAAMLCKQEEGQPHADWFVTRADFDEVFRTAGLENNAAAIYWFLNGRNGWPSQGLIDQVYLNLVDDRFIVSSVLESTLAKSLVDPFHPKHTKFKMGAFNTVYSEVQRMKRFLEQRASKNVYRSQLSSAQPNVSALDRLLEFRELHKSPPAYDLKTQDDFINFATWVDPVFMFNPLNKFMLDKIKESSSENRAWCEEVIDRRDPPGLRILESYIQSHVQAGDREKASMIQNIRITYRGDWSLYDQIRNTCKYLEVFHSLEIKDQWLSILVEDLINKKNGLPGVVFFTTFAAADPALQAIVREQGREFMVMNFLRHIFYIFPKLYDVLPEMPDLANTNFKSLTQILQSRGVTSITSKEEAMRILKSYIDEKIEELGADPLKWEPLVQKCLTHLTASYDQMFF